MELMLLYNTSIENLKSLYNNEFESIEIKSLDEETKVLLIKYVDIKKHPMMLLRFFFLSISLRV